MFESVSRFITGKRSRWLVVFAWLLVAMSVGAYSGKFDKAQKNEFSDYLPSAAESVKVLNAIKELPGGDSIQAITVFSRSGGLTAADRKHIDSVYSTLTTKKIPDTSPPSKPVISKDGSTALLFSDIKTSGDDSKSIKKAVEGIDDVIEGDNSGLKTYVTGPAGYSYDAIKIFEGTGSTLLIGAASLILILLILIYRSPIFWLIPAIAVGFAETVTRGVGYLLIQAGLTINTQSAQIMSVLVLGAGTDYALLLVSRYREELHHTNNRREAIQHSLQQAGPAIFGSGLTVIAALACLTLAEVNSTAGLGPSGAVGVAISMMAMLTLLPALLAILPRGVFWPFVPKFDHQAQTTATRGVWRSLGERVTKRPRMVWICLSIVLLAGVTGLSSYNTNLTQNDQFVTVTDSVKGQELISKAFSGGTNAPTDVIVAKQASVPKVVAALQSAPGVADVKRLNSGEPGTRLLLTLKEDPYAQSSVDLIPALRERAKAAGGKETMVGGSTAIQYDMKESSSRDNRLLTPLVLLIVLLILIVILRALVAPLLLIGTVIVSFAASFGIGALVFDHVFGYTGSDPQLFIFAFIFLVALGVDYNIFLMTRVREEALKHGTKEGMLRGLAATGSVITSAGVVLAGTFFVLMVLPLVQLVQIGFVIGFGVLLDTFLVRSILVPALTFDIGEKIWWPKLLKRS